MVDSEIEILVTDFSINGPHYRDEDGEHRF